MIEILIDVLTFAVQATVVLTLPMGLLLLSMGAIHPIEDE